MIKILHTADLHLDTPLSAMSDIEKARLRRAELRETFCTIVDMAQEIKADIVLMAGDILDNSLSSGASFAMISDRMRKADGIKFFIAPGNHDFAAPSSPWRLMEFSDNVHVFTSGIEKVDLDNGVTVYGAAFTREFRDEPILSGFRVHDRSRLNLMVLHGEVTTSPSRYDPITPEMIERSGLDYLALGHVHQHSGLMRCGDVYWCYPGTPEPRGFDETGVKGVVVIEAEKGKIRHTFVPTARRQYIQKIVDITGCTDREQVMALVDDTLKDISRDDIVRLTLKGSVVPELNISEGDIESRLKDRFYVKITQKLRYDADLDSIEGEQSLRGAFVRIMRKELSSAMPEQREMLESAMAYGLSALAGEDIAL